MRIPALVYALMCVAMWPSPLLGLVHVEASAIVAGFGFFIAGFSAIGRFESGDSLSGTLRDQVALLALPLLLLTATLLVRPNCGYLLGGLLFVVFTIPSVALGVALAYALSGWETRWPRSWLGIAGLAIAGLPVSYDLLLHPQLYTYNHVFGGVLGPIYDEELAIRPGLFAFRGLTLLWAVVLILLGRRLRSPESATDERTRLFRAGLATGAAMAAVYLMAVPLGINTSTGAIEGVLSEAITTDRFTIHFAPNSLSASELAWIVDEHAYRYEQLRTRLGVDVDESIHVYLYPDADIRADLIGSRFTSVTPVWLSTPQIHMLAEEFSPDRFGHELAHVFSREFGLPVIRASTAVGLVEGLAVAVEPPDGFPPARFQVAASFHADGSGFGELDNGPAPAVIASMSPFGFWSGRGAVSYATSGAFAEYLLDRFGATKFRQAYRTGDFDVAYGRSLYQLAADWETELRALEPDAEAAALATWRFGIPSLFERWCPHFVPSAVRLTREAEEAAWNGDDEAARAHFEEALQRDSAYAPAMAGLSRLLIGGGHGTSENAIRLERALYGTTRSLPDEADVLLIGALADVYVANDDSVRAARLYDEAIRRLPPYARDAKVGVILRRRLSEPGVRALFGTGDADARAARLTSLAAEEPELWFFAAGAWSAAGDYEQAYRVMDRFPPPEGLGQTSDSLETILLAHARLGLRALFADRARQYDQAQRRALVAARAYRNEGAEGPALLMDDLARKASWFLQRSN